MKGDEIGIGSADLPTFAGTLYAKAGVEPVLLALQDEHDLDVLLMLCACWLSAVGLSLSTEGWREIVRRHQPWQLNVTGPLRSVRRYLGSEASQSELYRQIKEGEIAAEWEQLQRLFEWLSACASGSDTSSEEQLKRCCAAQGVLGSPILTARIATLAAATP
ncbi:MAG TPA: TIGR02444 family protein [Pseudomonas xinjiangensis]|uniref:TIGR02444 family protein n=2 Tax=root TaxID=1 RepID=A0A7V1FR95_9GAMM|nr:TIGR02444 family protein [Halopseudomonas xinjiangensis]HEC48398.1 TIGR02444 family protein [Halopseudomonas xinjiangensis]